MQKVQFTVILTPPLVITADGDVGKEVFFNFPHQFCRELIIVPQTDVDKERATKLERSSDIVAYTFTVPNAAVKTVCKDIADEILRNDNFSPRLKILVEGEGTDKVISLSNINTQQLSRTLEEVALKA